MTTATKQAEAVPPPAAPRTTARQVLDYHVELHDRLARPSEAYKQFMAGAAAYTLENTDHSPEQFGAQPIPGDHRVRMMFYPYGKAAAGNPAVAGQFLADLARDLFDARTYQVTAEMCDLATAMMGQVAGKDIPLEHVEADGAARIAAADARVAASEKRVADITAELGMLRHADYRAYARRRAWRRGWDRTRPRAPKGRSGP